MLGTIEFPKEGELPYSDLFYKLYDNDLMRGISPGYLVDFDAAEYPKEVKGKGPSVIYNKQELLEVSFATLPANPDALRKEVFIKEAFELDIIDDDFIEKCYHQLDTMDTVEKLEYERTYEQLVEENKLLKDELEKSKEVEEEIIEEDVEVDIDYLDKDVQTETLDEADDPYADFYKALDEINQEQKDDDDPDILAGKVIESIESVDSKDDSEDDLDSLVGQVLNQ